MLPDFRVDDEIPPDSHKEDNSQNLWNPFRCFHPSNKRFHPQSEIRLDSNDSGHKFHPAGTSKNIPQIRKIDNHHNRWCYYTH
jgi:hypothetical protein